MNTDPYFLYQYKYEYIKCKNKFTTIVKVYNYSIIIMHDKCIL